MTDSPPLGEKRGDGDALSQQAPSECVRQRPIYFSVETGETLDWHHEFPESMEKLKSREDLSPEVKEKILYKNARAMYAL